MCYQSFMLLISTPFRSAFLRQGDQNQTVFKMRVKHWHIYNGFITFSLCFLLQACPTKGPWTTWAHKGLICRPWALTPSLHHFSWKTAEVSRFPLPSLTCTSRLEPAALITCTAWCSKEISGWGHEGEARTSAGAVQHQEVICLCAA